MTHAADQAKLSQQLIYFVIITLDVCNNTYGVAPCTATGGQCSNMIKDCEDPENYVKTSRDFYFCSSGVLLYKGLEVWPMIESVSGVVTKLDPQQKESTVINARYTLLLRDTSNPPPFFHDKGAGKFHDNRDGTYWRKLKAISPNYKDRRIQIFESLSTDPKADHVLASGLPDTSNMKRKFDGILKNIEEDNGKIIITASHDTDLFKEVQVPAVISSTNVIQNTETSGLTPDFDLTDTEISVLDTTEYRRATNNLFAIDDILTDASFTFVNPVSKVTQTRNFDAPLTFFSVTYDRRRRIVYFMDDTTSALYSFDPLLLIFTEIPGTFTGITTIAFNSTDDIMYGSDGTSLFEVQVENGGILLIGAHGTGDTVRDLTYDDRNGILYGLDDAPASFQRFSTFDTSDGTRDTVIKTSFLLGFNRIAHDTETDEFWVVQALAGVDNLYSVDVATGDTTVSFDLALAPGSLYIGLILVPSSDAYIEIIDSDFGDEILKVNFFDDTTNKIHVFRTALFGTSVVGHFDGKEVKQITYLANDNDTGADSDEGINAIDAILRLVNGEVKIPIDRIDLAELQIQMERWMRLFQVRRVIRDSQSSENYIREISTVTNSNTFMNEGGLVKTKAVAPDDPTVTKNTLDDTNDFKAAPKINDNKEEEAPVTVCHYRPKEVRGNKSSREIPDYLGVEVSFDPAISGVNFQNTDTPKRFFSPWLFRRREARTFTDRHRKRNEIAARKLKGVVTRKSATIDVGDLADVTVDEFEDQLGIVQTVNMQLTHKEELKNGQVNIEMLETRIERPIGFIAPSSQVGTLYDASTAAEQEYAFMGTGVDPRTKSGTDWTRATLGAAADEGRYFF